MHQSSWPGHGTIRDGSRGRFSHSSPYHRKYTFKHRVESSMIIPVRCVGAGRHVDVEPTMLACVLDFSTLTVGKNRPILTLLRPLYLSTHM